MPGKDQEYLYQHENPEANKASKQSSANSRADGLNDDTETHGEIIGNIEIVRIPLNLYRARNATSRKWLAQKDNDHAFTNSAVFLAGDAAIGSPYFQSISLGVECAIHLAGLIGQRDLPLTDLLSRYELYIYKQWLRVYMRSKMIKHNKDLFETIDDPFRLLDLLHIY